MLNWHDFQSDEEFINKIIELNNDDDLYLYYLNQPTYNFNVFEYYVDTMGEFLKKAIQNHE
jgi:hypothetical protein